MLFLPTFFVKNFLMGLSKDTPIPNPIILIKYPPKPNPSPKMVKMVTQNKTVKKAIIQYTNVHPMDSPSS